MADTSIIGRLKLIGAKIWSGLKRYAEVRQIRRKNKGLNLWEVTTDATGVTVHKNRRLYQTMLWADVRKLCIRQRDLFTYEQVSVFLVDGENRDIWIEELMVGFQPFCKAASDYFPGFADVVEIFCRNALGRWSAMPELWLDLRHGENHVVPPAWLESIPPPPKGMFPPHRKNPGP